MATDAAGTIQVPVVGMHFNSEEDIINFYQKYAYDIGFGVSKHSQSKYKEIRYYVLSCCRYGKSRSKAVLPFASKANQCPARLNVKVENEVHEITSLELEHNHDLSPGKSRHHRSNKKIDMSARRTIELNDDAGIRPCQTFSSVVHQAGGYENMTFGQSEARTYLRKHRLQLKMGDADALACYFHKQQAKDPNFYYIMDIDDEGVLCNVFWADGRMRAAYQEFGDVVTFDSTYLTNKYSMPFCPFVGINHHGQSILFGCALVASETIETFTWVFKTWLQCMGDAAPLGIITDQDAAMKAAIAEVLPDTYHRLCIWHVMQKMPKKLGGYEHCQEISKIFRRIVYESLREEQFENDYKDMILKYNLHNNNWLRTLFDIRWMWAPVYLRNKFWAGTNLYF